MKNVINLFTLSYEADKISRAFGTITIHISKDFRNDKFYAFLKGLYRSTSSYKSLNSIKRRLEKYKLKYGFNYNVDYLDLEKKLTLFGGES